MLHPKCFVLTTPQVVEGAPILVVDYSPEEWIDPSEGVGTGPEEGEFSGWTFLHEHESVSDELDLFFFDQCANMDEAVRMIIEKSVPGTYVRESQFSPFEAE